MSVTEIEANKKAVRNELPFAFILRYEHFFKYLLIGASASAIDVLLFSLLFNVLETSVVLAHSVSVPTAVLFSFFTNARHNFRRMDRLPMRLVSFSIVCAIGYALGLGVIVLAMAMGIDANLAKLLSLPIVFVTQYLLNSRVTFRQFATS